MVKKIDPDILAAAKSYEASLSESTPMTHYLVVWHDAGRTRMSAEWTKERAQALAYQVDGECFLVKPIDGQNGSLVEHVKRITPRQWRSKQMGRRMKS